MKWQPIETAPRDGTEILIYPCKDSSWFSSPHDRDVAHWDGRGWYLSIDDCVASYALSPTHWMPLEEPPK